MRTVLKKLIASVLTVQARAVVRKYKPRIIAITGSVGKTSAKDAIYSVMAHSANSSTGAGMRVRKSEKSFNSEIGLPLTILGLENAWLNPLKWLGNILDGLSLILLRARYPEWLVLEVGADRPGDIRKVAAWLPVDIAVITRLPEVPVHVEYFDSPEEVVEEKAALISALRPGGALALYGDDDRYAGLAARAPGEVITFGFSENAQVRGASPTLVFDGEGVPAGIEADISYKSERAHIKVMGAAGAHALLPAIAACAVGVVAGASLAECASALEAYRAPAGRMRLIKGLKGSLIIDDTYNSSPAALLAALETLGQFPKSGRRIAMLADMLELGRHSVGEHRKAGVAAAGASDLLITVGFRARDIAEGALEAGMPEGQILQFEDSQQAGKELEGMLKEGDAVLIKGSQSMRMERAVEEIMAEPERAPDLLVRQEEEWKKR